MFTVLPGNTVSSSSVGVAVAEKDIYSSFVPSKLVIEILLEKLLGEIYVFLIVSWSMSELNVLVDQRGKYETS